MRGFICILLLVGSTQTYRLNQPEVENQEERKQMMEELAQLPSESETYFENINPEISFDGTPLVESDMRLTPEQMLDRQALPNLWTEEKIPFVITEEVEGRRDDIIAALRQWESETCLQFEEVDNPDGPHLEFMSKGTECSSPVGRLNRVNKVSIGEHCVKTGIVMHEVGHSLGLKHQQARDDRDSYVQVMLDNITPGKLRNFKVAKNANNFSAPYDLTSVMHYGPFYFSKNNKPTMLPRTYHYIGLMGQRDGSSHRDQQIVNAMYGCSSHCTETAPKCENGGFLDKNCACVCPPRISGDNCENVPENYSYYKICGDENITTEGNFTSPNYPDIYDTGLYCFWIITAPAGKKVQLTFNKFRILPRDAKEEKCKYDFMQITADSEYTDEDKFCGKKLENNPFVSEGSKAVVILKTHVGQKRYPKYQKGFHATIKFV